MANRGGFQKKRFYFTIISRDFFKKRVLAKHLEWDIKIHYLGNETVESTSIVEDKTMFDNTKGEQPSEESGATSTNVSCTSFLANTEGSSLRSAAPAIRGRRTGRQRGLVSTSHRDMRIRSDLKSESSPPQGSVDNPYAPQAPAPSSSFTNFFDQHISKISIDDAKQPATHNSGVTFIRAKRRGVKKAPSATVPETLETSCPDDEKISIDSLLRSDNVVPSTESISVLVTSNNDGSYTYVCSFMQNSCSGLIRNVTGRHLSHVTSDITRCTFASTTCP